MAVTIKTGNEIALMRRANEIVAETLNLLASKVAVGVSTKELDALAEEWAKKNGALPAFKGYRGYPASLCVSINEQVVHGIPSKKVVIRDGDIVSIDFGVNFRGFFGDAALSVLAGKVAADSAKVKLLTVTRDALFAGIEQARGGNRVSDISEAVQAVVESNRLHVVKQFVGHGIGASLHEAPEVPNYKRPGRSQRLLPGMVLAIEPMVNVGTSEVEVLKDGWTVVTADRSLSAHFEHSVLITDGEPEVLSSAIVM
ncbi:MAG: type I methionyl aminopeptidase [Desulfobacteraceae bacterium]|nr:type I methionyl aminopeptidase [Desulfobacteraceae bacterium]